MSNSPTIILMAAVKEFAEAGLKGARMEAIARRAGLNKALVYRHFGSREELFDAALSFKFSRQLGVAAKMPEGLGDAMVYWFRHAADDRDYLRLQQREEMDSGNAPLVEEELRRAYYHEQVADVDRRKERGQIDDGLDSRFLMLALVALVSFPAFFPNMASLVTGKDVASKAFKAGWENLLRAVAQRLGPAPR